MVFPNSKHVDNVDLRYVDSIETEYSMHVHRQVLSFSPRLHTRKKHYMQIAYGTWYCAYLHPHSPYVEGANVAVAELHEVHKMLPRNLAPTVRLPERLASFIEQPLAALRRHLWVADGVQVDMV